MESAPLFLVRIKGFYGPPFQKPVELGRHATEFLNEPSAHIKNTGKRPQLCLLRRNLFERLGSRFVDLQEPWTHHMPKVLDLFLEEVIFVNL